MIVAKKGITAYIGCMDVEASEDLGEGMLNRGSPGAGRAGYGDDRMLARHENYINEALQAFYVPLKRSLIE